MEQNIAFERCVDFLARMIEKYGQELLDEINADEDGGQELKQKIQVSVNGCRKCRHPFYILNILKNWRVKTIIWLARTKYRCL